MKIELEGIEYTVTQKVISMDGATLILKRSEYSKRMIAEGLRATIDDCYEDIDRHQKMINDKWHSIEVLEKKLEELQS